MRGGLRQSQATAIGGNVRLFVIQSGNVSLCPSAETSVSLRHPRAEPKRSGGVNPGIDAVAAQSPSAVRGLPLLSQKRIGSPFLAEAATRAVPTDEADIVAKRQ